MWRRLLEVLAGSALLFVVLPLVVNVLGGKFADGVLIGTGVAIVWYTLETLDLRRETRRLRQVASQQIEIMTEQKEAAIQPLLVTRIETFADSWTPHAPYPRFVLRNIGHGPALFVEIREFTANIWKHGDARVEVNPVDVVEPGRIEIPQLKLHPVGGGAIPGYSDFIESVRPQGAAVGNYQIIVSYRDVRGRRFESVMQMGADGTRLLKYSPKWDEHLPRA